MFIGHLPAGYLMVRGVSATAAPRLPRSAFWAGLVGAIFPDIDLFRFFLIDNHAYHHHSYWTHKPLVWVMIAAIVFGVFAWRQSRTPLWVSLFFGGVLLHLCLDTISGDIRWLWPLYAGGYHLVEVQPTHAAWWQSFVFHWTFLLEILVCIGALAVAVLKPGRRG